MRVQRVGLAVAVAEGVARMSLICKQKSGVTPATRTTLELCKPPKRPAQKRKIGEREGLEQPRESFKGGGVAAPPVVAVNDRGHVVGQDHHRAKLSDHDIWLIHELRADGMPYKLIAEKFEVSLSTVESVCLGRRRAQVPTGQKRRRT